MFEVKKVVKGLAIHVSSLDWLPRIICLWPMLFMQVKTPTWFMGRSHHPNQRAWYDVVSSSKALPTCFFFFLIFFISGPWWVWIECTLLHKRLKEGGMQMGIWWKKYIIFIVVEFSFFLFSHAFNMKLMF